MWPAGYAMMEINVSGFLNHPGKRFPVDVRLDPVSASSVHRDLHFVEEIALTGEAFSQFDTLYLDTRIRTTIERACRRCLAPVCTPIDLHERFEAPIPAGSVTIDLGLLVVGLILTSLEPHPLCHPDCRGLCPVCGVDLNQHPRHTCQARANDRLKLGDFLR